MATKKNVSAPSDESIEKAADAATQAESSDKPTKTRRKPKVATDETVTSPAQSPESKVSEEAEAPTESVASDEAKPKASRSRKPKTSEASPTETPKRTRRNAATFETEPAQPEATAQDASPDTLSPEEQRLIREQSIKNAPETDIYAAEAEPDAKMLQHETDIDAAEAEPDAEMLQHARPAFEDIDPGASLPKLSRKRGIRRAKPQPMLPIQTSEVFIPRTLETPEPEEQITTEQIFFHHYSETLDAALDIPTRKKGVIIPRAIHIARMQLIAVPPHNKPEFRPEFLKSLPTSVPMDRPLTPERIKALVSLIQNNPQLLENRDYRSPFHIEAAMYRGRVVPPPKQVPAPEEEDIDSENVDLALEAIFDIFKPKVTPFIANTDDRLELAYLHITNHVSRITTLMCDWARSLPYIDKGAFGGPDAKPLYMCFYERFNEILTVDYEAARLQNVILRDDELRTRFSLDTLDILLLWLLVTLEIDPTFKAALRATWDQPTVVYMSAGALMRFICSTQGERIHVLSRLSPSSPMVNAGLIRIISQSTPVQPLFFELVVAEQIIKLFSGIRSLSTSGAQYAELQFPHFNEDTFLDPSHQKTIDIVRNYLERPLPNHQPNLERENLDFIPSLAFLVEGLPGSGRATFIKIVASRLDRPFIMVQGSQLNGLHPTDVEDYFKAIFIDAMLMNAIVCIRDAGPLLTEERTASIIARQLSLRPVICALCVELAVKTVPAIEPYITFKAKMDANLKDNAASFWKQHLQLPHLNNEHVDVLALSQRLALQPIQIQKATKLAYYQTKAESDTNIPVSNHTLERAAAVQVIKNIGNLAFVTEPEVDLSDVIVSTDIMDKIKKIIGSALNRRRVLYEWGLSKRIRRGTGVIALFDGDPGTGKTHSAEAIAHELGLSLMRINIANMVDKYIGETEKNLTTIFEQARPDMQLLLFDEADSLFTKRTSNVSKSNDRYSNMSVNVLLQLVERYEGVSILTTNLKNAIDPAFERRITYKVYFPMPKKPERERLWRYMCPPEIVTAEPIDYEWLSDLEMSGGEIKNAVLTAAFTAATQGVLLTSEILYDAGVSEATAAGRVMRRYEEGNDYLT